MTSSDSNKLDVILNHLVAHNTKLDIVITRLDRLEVRVAALELKVQSIDKRFDSMDLRLDSIELTLAHHTTLFAQIDQKLELHNDVLISHNERLDKLEENTKH